MTNTLSAQPTLSPLSGRIVASLPRISPSRATMLIMAMVFLCLAVAPNAFKASALAGGALFGFCFFMVARRLREPFPYAADQLFVYSLIIRLLAVLALYLFPPSEVVNFGGMGLGATGVLYRDEAYYLFMAQQALVNGISNTLSFSNQFDRISMYYTLIIMYVGAGRLINVFVMSVASVFMFKATSLSTSSKLHPMVWLVCAAAPELVMWSTTYLKEPLVILGTSAFVYAVVLVRRHGFNRKNIIFAFLGAVLLLFARPAMLEFTLPMLPLAYLVQRLKSTTSVFGVLFPLAIIAVGLFITNFETIASMGGRDTSYFAEQMDVASSRQNTIPLLSLAMSFPIGLREIAFFVLLMINPIITSLWSVISFSADWWAISTASYAITWWSLLPLWPATIYMAVKRGSSWWIGLSVILFCWYFTAANMRFGGGPDAFRYREGLFPLTFLMSMRGLNYMIYESANSVKWKLYLKWYATGVIALVFLRGIGLIHS